MNIYFIVVGSLTDKLKAVGPFHGETAAKRHAHRFFREHYWWVIPLQPPEIPSDE